MREIKFRAWDKKKKEMNWTDKASLYQGRAVKFNFMIPWRDNIFADEWELMQYTGLKDSKGVEIYEGDIVQSIYPGPKGTAKGVVEYVGYGWKTAIKPKATRWYELFSDIVGKEGDSVEVVGNIYENPELIISAPSKEEKLTVSTKQRK